MRYLTIYLLLSACAIVPLPAPKQPVHQTIPAAIWPDACVEDWYAKAQLPQCVESWITRITTQQKQIEKKHK